MDANTLIGSWEATLSVPNQTRTMTFTFDEHSFDENGKITKWSGESIIHFWSHKDGGWCIDVVLTQRHECKVTAVESPNTIRMTDPLLSCHADNLPIPPKCLGRIEIKCGPYLADNDYRITYDARQNALVATQVNTGRGGEYVGVYKRKEMHGKQRVASIVDLMSSEVLIDGGSIVRADINEPVGG